MSHRPIDLKRLKGTGKANTASGSMLSGESVLNGEEAIVMMCILLTITKMYQAIYKINLRRRLLKNSLRITIRS
ncbi:MAG: hypothetical protein QG657_429 [Acidobacteriota bacterium]|nr:hypothetical protein [Acidobacteriota bacterium]